MHDDAGWTGIEGVPNTENTAAAFLQGLARQKTRLVRDFKMGYTPREWPAFFQDEDDRQRRDKREADVLLDEERHDAERADRYGRA